MRSVLDREVLEVLVCPLTGGQLLYDEDGGELISKEGGLAYPIRDGIPVMLVDEARELSQEEKEACLVQRIDV